MPQTDKKVKTDTLEDKKLLFLTTMEASNSAQKNQEDWEEKLESWCTTLCEDPKYSAYVVREDLPCKKCNFGITMRTMNWSRKASADVYNYGICCNPDCKHELEEYS